MCAIAVLVEPEGLQRKNKILIVQYKEPFVKCVPLVTPKELMSTTKLRKGASNCCTFGASKICLIR